MGQSAPLKPIVLVVEDDPYQRALMAVLLEESGMTVIQCKSAEEAFRVLQRTGERLAMMFTDVSLAGDIDGVDLARFARQWYPHVRVLVTSGLELTKRLPDGTMFMPKPWLPLDVLREAERSRRS